MMVRWSRNGSSGCKLLGERSKSRPSISGAQRYWEAPHLFQPAAPCTCSMHTNRVRFAAPAADVPAHNRPAGNIASKRGTPNVTPMPCRTVRRERCFFVMYIACLLLALSVLPGAIELLSLPLRSFQPSPFGKHHCSLSQVRRTRYGSYYLQLAGQSCGLPACRSTRLSGPKHMPAGSQ